jgi:hypothetical protein
MKRILIHNAYYIDSVIEDIKRDFGDLSESEEELIESNFDNIADNIDRLIDEELNDLYMDYVMELDEDLQGKYDGKNLDLLKSIFKKHIIRLA